MRGCAPEPVSSHTTESPDTDGLNSSLVVIFANYRWYAAKMKRTLNGSPGRRSRLLLLCGTAGVAVAISACGGGSSGGSSDSGSDQTTVKGAKVVDVASMKNPPKGTVSYCTGKDITGGYHAAIESFNEKYASQGYKIKITEFPASADQQRAQFIQRQQAKAPDCDIFGSDVVWTAEFAAQGWLYDMTPYVKSRASEYIPSTLQTTVMNGR